MPANSLMIFFFSSKSFLDFLGFVGVYSQFRVNRGVITKLRVNCGN